MKNRVLAFLFAGILCFSGITAHANYDTAEAEPETKPSRTISAEGTGHVVDNISDGDNLQFISVTAKDGSVFFVVIDKQNTNDNVYFLNKVDISDLEALADDYKTQPLASLATPTPQPETTPTPAPEEKKEANNSMGMLLILLALAAVGIAGAYYFKIVIPKKKETENEPEYLGAEEYGDMEETVNEDNSDADDADGE